MSNLLKIRSTELMNDFVIFQNKVYLRKPLLSGNSIFQFTIKLNKKGIWTCQSLNEPKKVEIAFCKTSATLMKRLLYLKNIGKLDFAKDNDNSNEFHVALTRKPFKKRKFTRIKQLQFLF